MKRELRDKWLTALRSGQYEQGTRRLFEDGKYCCLGVLACVAGIKPDRLHGYATLSGFNQIKLLGSDGYETAALEEQLWRLNDIKGFTFSQIADFIEANVPVGNAA